MLAMIAASRWRLRLGGGWLLRGLWSGFFVLLGGGLGEEEGRKGEQRRGGRGERGWERE